MVLRGGIIKSRELTEVEQLEMYNELDNAYRDWLSLCLSNPDLDIFEISDNDANFSISKSKDVVTMKRESIAFTILLEMFEKAFLTLHDNPVQETHWTSWENSIKTYAERENFKKFYKTQTEQIKKLDHRMSFDPDFEDYMKRIMM